ncbi:hypothetical protein NDU88_002333 [Pleurodeles waltl]|uniref:Uncharacterized protein n=1 Tax=Pleurodeles waltl TaxID=8319 RepID=A0AAV7Q9I8_PLEWA|nr:hypothetical protein NDU88_002333 [Pleurodeles waltl]
MMLLVALLWVLSPELSRLLLPDRGLSSEHLPLRTPSLRARAGERKAPGDSGGSGVPSSPACDGESSPSATAASDPRLRPLAMLRVRQSPVMGGSLSEAQEARGGGGRVTRNQEKLRGRGGGH